MWLAGATLSPAPATTAVRPTPSVDPDCAVEITSESDPITAGDHGAPAAEYRAAAASGISVGPVDDKDPNVVLPYPGDALKNSHDTGRYSSRTLIACSLRPPLKVIAPAVTPLANRGAASCA